MTLFHILEWSQCTHIVFAGLIQSSRGLRQGDPFSSFLFLLCTKGLHGLIKKAANNGDINGFKLCKRGPKLTHLFFADDSLLFCRANSTKYSKVMDLLSLYEEVSGQKIKQGEDSFILQQINYGIIQTDH